jgi:acyl carrier protein
MSQNPGPAGPQFRADRPIEQESVCTTIVGGRPPGSGQPVGNIPRGIEVLVKKAAVDAAFKARLLSTRAAAAGEIGLRLEPAEAMMLTIAPAEQLEAVIARTAVPQEHRRAFLGQAAAAMLGVLAATGGVTTAGQILQAPGGVAPDRPYKPAPPYDQGRVVHVVAASLELDDEDVAPESLLADDLGADAASFLRLRAALNKEFKIKLTPESFSFKKIQTVGDAAAAVQKAVERRDRENPPPPSKGASGGIRPR